MELRKKNLHMMQKKSEAQNQITFDEDYNVPDQKADIGQIGENRISYQRYRWIRFRLRCIRRTR